MPAMPMPIVRFREELLSMYASPRYARKTWLRMRQVMLGVQALPGVESTADLTTQTMAAYVQARGPDANPNTTNGLIDYLRAACSFAVEEGYLDRPPNWRRVRPRPRRPTRNRPLSYAEAARLLDRLRRGAVDWEGRRLHALYGLVLLTGCRLGEAIYARVEDLDLAVRSLRIRERPGKRLKTFASDRTVPLPEALVPVLSAWTAELAGCPWLFPGVRRLGPWAGGMPGRKPLDALQAAAKLEGIEGVTWHGLRHTFGSQALLAFDIPLWVVQAVMGHTDLRTTQRYLHLGQPAVLAERVRAMAYPLPN